MTSPIQTAGHKSQTQITSALSNIEFSQNMARNRFLKTVPIFPPSVLLLEMGLEMLLLLFGPLCWEARATKVSSSKPGESQNIVSASFASYEKFCSFFFFLFFFFFWLSGWINFKLSQFSSNKVGVLHFQKQCVVFLFYLVIQYSFKNIAFTTLGIQPAKTCTIQYIAYS